MRAFAVTLGLIPTLSTAETFELYAPVKSVLAFADAAQITREVEIDLPAGNHELIIPASAVENLSLEQIRIEGVTIQQRRLIERDTPRPETMESIEVAMARAALKAAQSELKAVKDQQAELLLPKADGEARLAFMTKLGENGELVQVSGEDLASMITTIGEQSRKASEMVAQAEIAAHAIEDALDAAEHNLALAEQSLLELVGEDNGQFDLAIQITVPTAIRTSLHQTQFTSDVYWEPTYEFHLNSPDSDTVEVRRSIQFFQNGTEGWTDIDLSLTTAALMQETKPAVLFPLRRSITQPAPKLATRTEAFTAQDVMVEAPVVMEDAAMGSHYDGFYSTYSFPQKISLPISNDAAELKLDPLVLDVELFAQAVPEFDETAYLMAKITNTSGIPLPANSSNSAQYLNDQLVGFGTLDTVTTGQTFDLGFGPIDGLRLSSVVLDDNAGDRGFLRGRHVKSQSKKYTLENFTDRDWEVRVLARVPYSAQEDLQIEWDASERPDTVNVEDKRGVLLWNLSMAPGQEKTILLDHTLNWPEGWELR